MGFGGTLRLALGSAGGFFQVQIDDTALLARDCAVARVVASRAGDCHLINRDFEFTEILSFGRFSNGVKENARG